MGCSLKAGYALIESVELLTGSIFEIKSRRFVVKNPAYDSNKECEGQAAQLQHAQRLSGRQSDLPVLSVSCSLYDIWPGDLKRELSTFAIGFRKRSPDPTDSKIYNVRSVKARWNVGTEPCERACTSNGATKPTLH
jgi:hypothetical protein